ADFNHKFDWLKELIDRDDGPFHGKIGWEENSNAPWSVLDLISLMTLFHPWYDAPGERMRRAPTVAFSSKGTSDKPSIDGNMEPGYLALGPVLEDILRLHDFVYLNSPPAYNQYIAEAKGKTAKLALRRGFEKKQHTLPLTGSVSEFRIDKGVLYPLLAS